MNDATRQLALLVDAHEVRLPLPLAGNGSKLMRGFDHTSELDGMGDELLWQHAVGGERLYDDIDPRAPYLWTVRRGTIVIQYCEGDIDILTAPDLEAARAAYELYTTYESQNTEGA
jgi:hypothetical protein